MIDAVLDDRSRSTSKSLRRPPTPPDTREIAAGLLNAEDHYAHATKMAIELIQNHHAEHDGDVGSPWKIDGRSDGPDAILDHCARLLNDSARGGSMSFDSPPRTLAQYLLLQYAPLGLTGGVVLQNFSNASNCHEPARALSHRIHGWHVGEGMLEAHHAALFRQLLESVDVMLPPVDSDLFERIDEICDEAWSLVAYRLALSMFPSRFRYETLGAMLFELDVLIPSILQNHESIFRDVGANCRYFDVRRIGDSSAWRQTAADAIASMVEADREAAIDDGETGLLGVLRGYRVSLELMSKLEARIRQDVESGILDPERRMIDLVRRKGRFAIGYHQKLKLAGQPFDRLIVEAPDRFVAALARSFWISPGAPEKSKLLKELIEFGGPMFRVFSDAEVSIIHRWIASLPKDLPRLSKADLAAFEREGTDVFGEKAARPSRRDLLPFSSRPDLDTPPSKHPSLPIRELYYRLINVEDYPDARQDGLLFARQWLARSAHHLKLSDMPFQDYAHKSLRKWFDEQGQKQAASYAPKQEGTLKTREDVIGEAVHLCPMILIDGGWIQRWTNAGLVDTQVGTLLYKIFSDEVGNGDVTLNHPNVYRDLMADMGVEIADHRSRAFAEDPLFEDDAFMVPAFWLSISQFPRRFTPETLGLNLAMELSGVGGAYREARDDLHHYGFSTLFVDLHNTIDNVSTGHSAMAAEAIEVHMDHVLKNLGQIAKNEHWRRVWIGYRSLATPAPSWKELFVSPSYPH